MQGLPGSYHTTTSSLLLGHLTEFPGAKDIGTGLMNHDIVRVRCETCQASGKPLLAYH